MRKLISFMHLSLDGYAAGPGGEMDWIHVDEEIFEYVGNQIDETDTALYGRVTYEMMQDYWPTAGDQPNASKHDRQHSAWYKQVSKVILSRSMKGTELPNSTIISDNTRDEIIKLKQSSGKNIVIFGSPTATHSLMAENLVNDYWLFVNPVLLGQGIPFFKNIRARTKLNLVATHVFPSGVICLHYEMKEVVK